MSATSLNKNNSGTFSFSPSLTLFQANLAYSRQENPPRGKGTCERRIYRLHCRTARGLPYLPPTPRQIFTCLIPGRHICEYHSSLALSGRAFIQESKEWHCTIRGPAGTEFEGGLYHFRILLPSEYPFRPPSILMLTPNGRFELNTKVRFLFPNRHSPCAHLYPRSVSASPTVRSVSNVTGVPHPQHPSQ